MKIVSLFCMTLALATACFAQTQPEVWPKHIESPTYPQIAVNAHLTGKVSVQVTIQADGRVSDAEAVSNGPWELLRRDSTVNAKTWTFTKPPRSPCTLTIVYEYRLDASLPNDYGRKILFDLPEHVTLLAGLPTMNTEKAPIHGRD